MPSVRTAVCLATLSLAVLAAPPVRAAGPGGSLTPLPTLGDDGNPVLTNRVPEAEATAPDSTPAGSPAPSALDRVRRGVVLVERDGRLLGFGTVLAGDGRILTSLSALAVDPQHPGEVDVRYADGAVVHARVGHRDPTWDLALLVPRTIHWKDGLSASKTDPASVDLRAPIPPRMGARPIALPVHYKGRTGRHLPAGRIARRCARRRSAQHAPRGGRADPRRAGGRRGCAGTRVQAGDGLA